MAAHETRGTCDKDFHFANVDSARLVRGGAQSCYSSLSGSIPIFCSPACRFSQYLRTQASQLRPAAVSRPEKETAAMSAYAKLNLSSLPAGNSRTNESFKVLPS